MLISFIIAAYNAEQYLLRCIESCLHIKCEKEIIIINDGSTDGTLSVIEKIIDLYPKEIKVINQPNRGVSNARNAGISAAYGEWLFFVDADDYVNAIEIENILRDRQLDDNIDVCTFGVNFVYHNKIETHRVKDKIYSTEYFLNSGIFQLASWNYIFRRKLVICNGIRFPEGIICTEDQNFNIKCLCCTNKIISFDTIIYNYNCINSNSVSKKKHSVDWIKSRLSSANELLTFCINHSITSVKVQNQVKRLYESYMMDNTTNIGILQKGCFFKKEYKQTISMLPTFKNIWKFWLCSRCFYIGAMLFYTYKKVQK